MEETKKSENPFKGLRYEHVVPVSVLGEIVCESKTASLLEKFIYALFKKFCIACVIDADEEEYLKPNTRKMPDNWDQKDIWARYKCESARQKIKVGIIKNDNWQKIHLL